MADIELVIKIPEEDWKFIKEANGCRYSRTIIEAVINGTPLPKGHGRLIEVNENLYQEIRKWVGVGMASELLDNAPTIVAKDRGSEE